jgi:CBS domain-containing protein
MMRVSDLMSDHVLAVTPGTSVRTVARIMMRERIGSVCVVGDHDELIGLITEADLLQLELHQDPTRHLVPVDVSTQEAPLTAAEVMTTDVVAVPPDSDVADIARMMLADHLTRVPVVEGAQLVGVLSRSDLLQPLCRPDDEIAAELVAALSEVPGDWQATVYEGHVRLEGRHDGIVAARVAWRVPGVAAVSVPESPD